MERQKMKHMRKTHGIYPLISLLNIFQLPVHMVYISMINRISFNYDINPAILNEGFFWFKDLSSPDPTGILPVMGGIISLLNILTTSNQNTSSVMRKIRKYIYILPLISIPVWMTFPVVSIFNFQSFLLRHSICTGWQLPQFNLWFWIFSDRIVSAPSLAFPSTYQAVSWSVTISSLKLKPWKTNLKY